MQIKCTKLIFVMNFSVLHFFKFASRMPQILVLTFKIFLWGERGGGGDAPRPPKKFPPFFFISNSRLCILPECSRRGIAFQGEGKIESLCLVCTLATSVSRAAGPGFDSCLHGDFSRSGHTSDFKIGTPVATLPGAWHYRVSAVSGWPGVSIL